MKKTARINTAHSLRTPSGMLVYAIEDEEDFPEVDEVADEAVDAAADEMPDFEEEGTEGLQPGDEVLVVSLEGDQEGVEEGTLEIADDGMLEVDLGGGEGPEEFETEAVRKLHTCAIPLSALPQSQWETGMRVRVGKVMTTLHRPVNANVVTVKTAQGPRRVHVQQVEAVIKAARLPKAGTDDDLIGIFRNEKPSRVRGSGVAGYLR